MSNNPIIKWMDQAIAFFEAAILRFSIFFLLIGFIAATISLLTARLNTAQAAWFLVAWAVVQACAIDGLFFGVWFRFRDTPWSEHPYLKSWYGLVGLLLGFVAVIVSMTVTYQGLSDGSSVTEAIARLGISVTDFATARAVIVVIVTILVATLPRESQAEAVPEQKADPQAEAMAAIATAMAALATKISEEKPSKDERQLAIEAANRHIQVRYHQIDEEEQEDSVPELSQAVPELSQGCPSGTLSAQPVSKKEAVKQFMVLMPHASIRFIAQSLKFSKSTVERILQEIREEEANEQ